MSRTPGFIVPSSYSSPEELKEDLRLRSEEAGFTSFNSLIGAYNKAKILAKYGPVLAQAIVVRAETKRGEVFTRTTFG